MRISRYLKLISLILLLSLTPFKGEGKEKLIVSHFDKAVESIEKLLDNRIVTKNKIAIDTFHINNRKRSIRFTFSRGLSEYPLRSNDATAIYSILRNTLPEKYRKYNITVISNNTSLDDLYSRYFSHKKDNRHSNLNKNNKWITNESRPFTPREGLHNQYLALWSGHGYHFCNEEQRWKWQRAPYFTTIEDLLTFEYLTSYIAPMLENAGAYVLIPRERDHSTTEIIVDNDSPFYNERTDIHRNHNRWYNTSTGYIPHHEHLSEGENPFEKGSARAIRIEHSSIAQASYLPYFPKTEKLSVYISYQSVKNSTKDAKYTVRHLAGETTFRINQTIGGGTWIYLGEFTFEKGESGHGVIVSTYKTENNSNKILTTDAVKFGGGMGNIQRNGIESKIPKYAEASRYWLQNSGFSPDVYHYTSSEKKGNDYKDDYFSKGLWVNELINKYNVPISLAVGIHSDAGKFKNDSTVGTLAIYTRVSENKNTYPDGTSRIISRELADIIQTQIIEDVRKLHNSEWNRRQIWDRSYVEARVPNIPTILLEMFAHQNFQDMKYGLDPKVQFTISRAIYKGILKYSAYINEKEYTVQPLPVKNFHSNIHFGSKVTARLQWDESIDPLESTATADHYIVYTQIIDPKSNKPSDFDKGIIVNKSRIEITIEPDKIYKFKVCAINKGGISFPSETLSIGYTSGRENKTALIVNNFYRCSSASYFENDFSTNQGHNPIQDSGVPYIETYAYVGKQYNFNPEEDWQNDFLPGYGASYLDYGFQKVAGNTFDYPYAHGTALLQAGISFVSTSAESFYNGEYNLSDYELIDIICGKERDPDNIFPKKMQERISEYIDNRGNLIISGAYLGFATIDTTLTDSTSQAQRKQFAEKTLQFKYANSYATSSGRIVSEAAPYKEYRFATEPNPQIYCAESTDAIIPLKNAKTLYRYVGSNTSATTYYKNDNQTVIVSTFPIEILTSQHQINELMREVVTLVFDQE